jgi:hypothetical protein
MKRLIDDKEATVARLYNFIWGNVGIIAHAGFKECMEELYTPIAEWCDKINPADSDTWVLCFVTDNGSSSRHNVVWVQRYKHGLYPFTCVSGEIYKHATPVDLRIKYEVQS